MYLYFTFSAILFTDSCMYLHIYVYMFIIDIQCFNSYIVYIFIYMHKNAYTHPRLIPTFPLWRSTYIQIIYCKVLCIRGWFQSHEWCMCPPAEIQIYILMYIRLYTGMWSIHCIPFQDFSHCNSLPNFRYQSPLNAFSYKFSL